jgi:hypothetical protein
MSKIVAKRPTLCQVYNHDKIKWASIWTGSNCTALLNLRIDIFSFVTILFANNSIASEALVPKGIW